MMTGITRVRRGHVLGFEQSENSVFHLERILDSFGFTEPEVFAALDEFGLSDRKEELKQYVIHSTPSWEMRNMNCS